MRLAPMPGHLLDQTTPSPIQMAKDRVRSILLRQAIHSPLLDAVLRRRAKDIVKRTGLDRHLPAAGLLLDLGSGFGHVAEAVQQGSHRRCIGVDPVWSPPPALSARLAGGGPQFMHGDGAVLPFPTQSFDGGWCAFVLHHLSLQQQGRVLAEAARVLRPGAPFILIEDTPATAATLRADRRLNAEQETAIHTYRSPPEWRHALAEHGLLPQEEMVLTTLFPRATWAAVPHRAFICRRGG